MFFSQDMKDLLTLFNSHGVSYVLVGGFAVNYYGYIRTTQDMDVLILPSKENAEKVMFALTDFGFGKAGIHKELFEEPGNVLHLGVEPNRIDLLTHLIGISNQQIFSNCKKIEIDAISLNIIAYNDLIQVKKASKRLRDQADADELEKIASVD
jgi:predicted nucleotidyltransferase